MYLHLGQSVVVPFRDVVGVFDLDNASSSHLTRAFLERAEKEGRVVNVSDDLPRSFVGGEGGTGGERVRRPAPVLRAVRPGQGGRHGVPVPAVRRHPAAAGGEQQF